MPSSMPPAWWATMTLSAARESSRPYTISSPSAPARSTTRRTAGGPTTKSITTSTISTLKARLRRSSTCKSSIGTANPSRAISRSISTPTFSIQSLSAISIRISGGSVCAIRPRRTPTCCFRSFTATATKDQVIFPGFAASVDDQGYQIEAQYLYKREWLNLTAGFGNTGIDSNTRFHRVPHGRIRD